MVVRAGENIPLWLQLWDGSSDKHVRAFLYNKSEALIATKNLTHVGHGLYVDRSEPMPNDDVNAAYVVYDDGAYSQESAQHCRAGDYYQVMRQFIAAEIKGDIVDLEHLSGQVSELALKSEVEGQNLQGEVTGYAISGTIETPELSADVESDSIDGETGC